MVMGPSARLMAKAMTVLEPVAGAKDALNRTSWTYPGPGTPVKGNKQQTAAREVSTPTGTAVVVDWLFVLPIGTPVGPRSRIVADGLTFEVASVDDAGGMGHHLEVLARVVS